MSRVSDVMIERVHLGEATSEQRARVLASPEARTRLAALIEADAAFLKAHPAEAMVPEIERRVHLARVRDGYGRRNKTLGWIGAGIVPLAAAAVAFVALAPPPGPQVDGVVDPIDGVILPKGLPPKLHVIHKDRGSPRSIGRGAVLRQGEQLQLGYTSGDALHGVLFSLDGRGTVTLHAPDGSDTTLERGRHLMPFAYQLDDAPEFERFFLVTGDHALDVEAILDLAEGLPDPRRDPLALPDDLDQQDFLIRKETR